MQTFLNSLIFFVLSAFGLSTYFLNPYRSGSLIVGLLLQAFAIVVLFLSTVSQKHALNRYKNAAKDTVQSNRRWLIGSIAAVCIGGALLLIGIPYSFLRFILFLLLWLGAIGAGQYLCYFIWRRNNEELAEQLVKEDEEKRAQELAAQERAKAAAEQMRKEALERAEAEAAQQKSQHYFEPMEHEIPSALDSSKGRPRIEDLPDLSLVERMLKLEDSALAEALAQPTRAALASVEETIARNTNNRAVFFYHKVGKFIDIPEFIKSAERKLLYLAQTHQLYVNPSWSQYLIASIGSEQLTFWGFFYKANDQQDIYACQLLDAQMQLVDKLGITLGSF
jgi:hypothetical protein